MSENELFYQLVKLIAEQGQGVESYEVDSNNFISEIAYRIYNGACTDYQMYISKVDNGIQIYVESEITGNTATQVFKDSFEAETFLNNNEIVFEEVKIDKLNTYLIDESEEKETILQSISKIESEIYLIPYDGLTEYLQGVRDVINLINGEENNTSIRKHIIEQLREINIPF